MLTINLNERILRVQGAVFYEPLDGSHWNAAFTPQHWPSISKCMGRGRKERPDDVQSREVMRAPAASRA